VDDLLTNGQSGVNSRYTSPLLVEIRLDDSKQHYVKRKILDTFNDNSPFPEEIIHFDQVGDLLREHLAN
jgi:hypothetical protein